MPLTALTGTRIRQRRSLIGLQQAELARAAGISASYLNLIEHNRRKVAGGVLTRIAGALGVDAAALTGGAEATLLDDLREAASAAVWGGAAAPAGGTRPEIDRIEDFVSRFPGWAALVVAQVRRIAQLDRAVEALSDRMSHDPHLSAALHEVLSAVAAVRSTATILTDTPNLEPVWRSRFERNLAADSARLAHGAEALVAYLDAVSEQDSAIAAPLEEREAWLAARGWTLPEPETGEAALPEAPELASAAARSLAADWIATAQRDAAALPLSRLGAHLTGAGAGAGPDPGAIARAFGVDLAAVLRRLAMLPQAALPPGVGPYGLVLCDGAGALLLRKPVAGFGMPRFGAACPRWPLFAALTRPGLPLRCRVAMPGPAGARFVVWALGRPRDGSEFAPLPVLEAVMLILPDAAGDAAGPVEPVGVSCRICPRGDCTARREPAIVSAG